MTSSNQITFLDLFIHLFAVLFSIDTTTSYKKSDADSAPSELNAVSAVPGAKDSSAESPAIQCQPTGIYSIADPSECNAYYQCDKGIRTKMTCPERQLFDLEKRECTEYERVFCGARTISSADKNQCKFIQPFYL
jgi:hypothetical protein